MASTPRNSPDHLHDRIDLAAAWRFLMRERVRYVIAWLAALVGAAICLYGSWISLDDSDRADGNGGHMNLDFSGQWLMGHLVARGYGMHLYDRGYQRTVLIEAFPDEDGDPRQKRNDVEDIMWAMMGNDDDAADAARRGYHVGGPLYPPVNALFCVPLGMLPPRTGYRLYQVASTLLLFVVALGMGQLARGRVWVPVIMVALLLVPGPARSISLGQNAVFTLALLVWGWVLVAHGRPGWGGVVWGLLAYKPVWAMAFLLVPVLTRRWRMALTMLATGVALVAVTLPFVGLHSWLDWLALGPEVTETYNTDENWIRCSRDLLGIPRRLLLDFNEPKAERAKNWLAPTLIGWGIWAVALEITLLISCLRWRRLAPVDGPPAAFVMLGAWLCCFHFMHYDVFLAALPIMLLFTEPRRYLEPVSGPILPIGAKKLDAGFLAANPPGTSLEGGQANIWLLNRMAPTLLVLFMLSHWLLPMLLGSSIPWDTICLIGFWFWCGWLSLEESV
jgi:hypothetical protein